MNKIKNIKREDVWLGCMALGLLTAFGAVYNPALSVVAIIFLVIGIKGIRYDML